MDHSSSSNSSAASAPTSTSTRGNSTWLWVSFLSPCLSLPAPSPFSSYFSFSAPSLSTYETVIQILRIRHVRPSDNKVAPDHIVCMRVTECVLECVQLSVCVCVWRKAIKSQRQLPYILNLPRCRSAATVTVPVTVTVTATVKLFALKLVCSHPSPLSSLLTIPYLAVLARNAILNGIGHKLWHSTRA